MTDLNNEAKRQELISRYLNAETTIEEERFLLDYYTQTEAVLTPEEEDLKLVIISTNQNKREVELSEEKEAAFDKMMEDERMAISTTRPCRKPSNAIWPTFLAAAVVLAFVLVTKKPEEAPIAQQHAKSTVTALPYTHQDKRVGTTLQKEKDPPRQTAMEEIKTSAQTTTILAYDKKESKPNIPTREEGKAEVPSSEAPNTEVQTVVTAKTAPVELTAEHYPLNVSTANYSKMRNDYDFTPQGNITFYSKVFVNGNTQKHIITTSTNGMNTLYSKVYDDSVIYKIDGKWATEDAASQIPLDSIEEMRTLQRGSDAAVKESPFGRTNDIILITTKKSKRSGNDQSSFPSKNSPLMTDNNTKNGICLL